MRKTPRGLFTIKPGVAIRPDGTRYTFAVELTKKQWAELLQKK